MLKKCIFILLLGVFSFGCSSKDAKKSRTLLYIQSESGVIRVKKGLTSYYTIALQHPSSPAYLFYTDPMNDLETVDISGIVSFWEKGAIGFVNKVPEAAIVVTTEEGNTLPLLFTVQDPEYDGVNNTLTFNAYTDRALKEKMADTISGKITLLIEAGR